MRSTVARRLSTLASFHRYCEEGVVDQNLTLNVRRPKLDYESGLSASTATSAAAFLESRPASARRVTPRWRCYLSSMCCASEALDAHVEHVDFEQG